MIAILTYRNFLEFGGNSRLSSYYDRCESEGKEPCFFFLTGASHNTAVRYRNFGSEGISGILAYFPAILRGVLFFLLNRKFKIIYVYSPSALWWPLIWAARISGKAVIRERTEWYEPWVVHGLKARFLKLLFRLDEQLARSKTVVISERIAAVLKKQGLGSERICVIPAFVDSGLFPKEGNEELAARFRVGYLGSFGEKDGVPELIGSVREVWQSIPGLSLKLMGNCPPEIRGVLQDEAGDLPLHFTGTVDRTELLAALRSCDLLISNRDGSLYSQFGFPGKLLEYLGSGVPVISSDSSGVRELFEDERHLRIFRAGEQDELIDLIRDRYANYAAWDEMGARGQQYVLNSFGAENHLGIWREFVFGGD